MARSSQRRIAIVARMTFIYACLNAVGSCLGMWTSFVVLAFAGREGGTVEIPWWTWGIAGQLAGLSIHVLLAITSSLLLAGNRKAIALGATWAVLAFLYGIGQAAFGVFGMPGINATGLQALVLIVLWCMVPPVAVGLELSRLKFSQTNVCTECGYDLRGLPEPRCPECGTSFSL